MIEVKQATKVFSSKQGPAISSVSFGVKNGEVVGFVGLNGAGKTTTI
ncbi:MAG TPA: ATP-binding cassette domain-containing protein, partial [Candidatus Bathyarchaeia archaeon]